MHKLDLYSSICIQVFVSNHLYPSICIQAFVSKYFYPSICIQVFVSKHLYRGICIQVFVSKSEMLRASPRERDHFHKFPRQLHLSSHYTTHLPIRACCHEATFSKTLAGVFFWCLFMYRNGTKILKNLGRRFHEWKLV